VSIILPWAKSCRYGSSTEKVAGGIEPNVETWRAIRRIVARVNPKVQDADLDQILVNNAVRNLEESGFLPEMKKKLPH
jgi:hypothetical protein